MRPLRLPERVASAAEAALLRMPARRFERLSPEVAREVTLGRIRRLVDHAFASVPFYRERYARAGYEPGAIRSLGDLRHLPAITKDDLLAEPPERLLSARVPASRRLPSLTSGTSGQVLTVWHDAGRLGRIGVGIVRVAEMVVPYRPWDATLYVYTSPLPVRSVFGLYPFRFVPTTAPVERIAAAWRRARPAIVWVYPSRLRDLEAVAGDLPPPRLVSVNSELSSGAERARWEEVFRAPVRDQYSTEELALVAAECGERRRHLFTDLCWVEILGGDGQPLPPGKVGEVAGTNLANTAMPLIRYRQGDLGALALAGDPCPCGRTLPVLDPLLGRARVDLRTPSGQRVASGVVVDALYGLILELRLPLRAYQLADGDPPELRLAPRRPLSGDEVRAAADHLHRTTGLVVVARVLDDIPVAPSGKHEAVLPRKDQGS